MPTPFSYGLLHTPRFSTVTAAFQHQVATQPDTIAAQDMSSEPPISITYGQLASRSARLAHKLRALGILPGDRVPLVVKRGIDMLVGIFAVLSCRAQYVPLDGSVVPDATLRLVLEQTRCCTVLALSSTRHRLWGITESKVVAIDDLDDKEEGHYPLQDIPQVPVSPEDGCYVIYTSGVDVTHRNVTNLICQTPGDLGIVPGTRVGQVLSISFDMAAWEILGCLANGGTLVLRGSKWEKTLQKIDVLICTPSILAKYAPADYPSLKLVATAGEPSSQKLADAWTSHCTYYNCCGPTETTIVNTMHQHRVHQELSIGTPTPNNVVYLLDKQHDPVGIGEIGVMWAGGSGVTRGYVALPSKTAENYVLDPFKNDGSRIYNTGDLCRWNANGSINMLGRVDDQVKVKGFRVELDGVAASLASCASVDRAAALLIDGEIHGFLTPRDCDLEIVTKSIIKRQPYYAIPAHFHLLDSLPITFNGKIDRKALMSKASEPEQWNSTKTSSGHIRKPEPALLGHSRSDSSASTLTQNSMASEKSDITVVDENFDLEAALPEKRHRKYLRGLRYRALIVYRRLFTLVGIFNIAATMALVFSGIRREWIGTITAINLTTAILIRQDFIINLLYTVSCSVPKSWPLCIRARCAKIYHLGGIHSGAAIAAGAWLLAGNIGDVICMASTCSNWDFQSIAGKTISWLLSALFFVMFVLAYPLIRKTYHDLFEKTHRFVGWTMLGLFWAQILITCNDTKGTETSFGSACVRSPSFWLLAVATASVASSWAFLRKVPVQAEVLSDHAVRLHFDYTVPVNGSFTRLSKSPLLEWHSFATIPAPEASKDCSKGYSLVVSNAGDWTKSTIQQTPTNIWTRGVPTCGVMRIATLFNRVVLIATGSGIGPVLGHIQNPSCATQLIWSTSQPEKTFGHELCDKIKSNIPGAVIHDTKRLGRPDLVKMSYNLAKGFKAEAIIIIANEKITKKVVYGLESRGMPAFGAIWDS
ncbi:hypothetical protein B0J13DRAFT_432911 [Dactylonectria estremocensis]|uniref:AMP-dependent synthetase/ligase domain-containing protein n=1 Tax=Dactylonectria estremocensis TaxID=1079267 RepID=A0A9P9FF27_9HYPO|nr:hypothetical protein B0J13DRAFT_432911 [Dactylonectria estremocensis]